MKQMMRGGPEPGRRPIGRTRTLAVALVAMVGLLWCPPSAAAKRKKPSSAASVVESSKPIEIRATDVPLGEVLADYCKKAGWGLMVETDSPELDKSITVHLLGGDDPMAAISVLLSRHSLAGHLSQGVLVVQQAAQGENGSLSDTDEQDSAQGGREISVRRVADLSRNLEEKLHDKFDRIRQHSGRAIGRIKVGEVVTVGDKETVTKAISIGNDVVIKGTTNGNAISIGGDVTVLAGAHVHGDVISVGGQVIVADEGAVDGDAVVVGGQLQVEAGAQVLGDRVSVNLPMPAIRGMAGVASVGMMFWIITAVLRSLALLLIALFVGWLAPQRIVNARETLRTRMGISLLVGFVMFIGLLPAVAVLGMTLVGIPLIPVLGIAFMVVVVFGLCALLSTMGHFVPWPGKHRSEVGALFLGFVVFLLVNMIPVLGVLLVILASIAAAGAAFVSRLGKRPAHGG